MEYRKYGETYYIRMDRGDEVIEKILELCENERILSATYSGIGGCGRAEIQNFVPETGSFELQELNGMLDLVSLTGNLVTDDGGRYYHHTHAVFSFKKGESHCVAAGHIKSITVSYTAEIELHPVVGGAIKKKFDPESGIGFWSFSD
jgi:hypothetical protein